MVGGNVSSTCASSCDTPQGAETKNKGAIMCYLHMTWHAMPTFHKGSDQLLKDMGTPASSFSHCTKKLMPRTLYSSVRRCRNPDHPDVKTIDKNQQNSKAYTLGYTHSCYAVNKQWIILIQFWDYGYLRVACLSEEAEQCYSFMFH